MWNTVMCNICASIPLKFMLMEIRWMAYTNILSKHVYSIKAIIDHISSSYDLLRGLSYRTYRAKIPNIDAKEMSGC